MKSKTKTEFSKELLLKLVHAQFGGHVEVSKINSLDDGWFNTAYQICFSDSIHDTVLRIAPHPDQPILTYEKDLMRRELSIHRLLAEAEAAIPLPEVLAADTSRSLIDRDYMFVERYSGTPFNKLPEDVDQQAVGSFLAEVGRATAKIHTIKGKSFGYPDGGPGSGSKSWREALLEILFVVLSDGHALGVRMPLSYKEIKQHLLRNAFALDEITVPALVHWDLWGGNIFTVEESDGLSLEGIIDWERALWADPEFETVYLLNAYGEKFIEGYGKELSSGPGAEIRHCLYRVYLWLVMVIEDLVRFEEADHVAEIYQNQENDLVQLQNF